MDIDNPQENKVDNYTNYSKFSIDERYQYCLKNYDNFLEIKNRETFKKSLHMRYYLNDKYHNFYYDYDMDKFLLNSTESDTADKIDTLNQMIIYLRVHNMDETSINWIHPLYSRYIQYLNDNSQWCSLSDFL